MNTTTDRNCQLSSTTNAKLGECLAMLDLLISWADADAQDAAENDAPMTAKDDKARARTLRRASRLIDSCYRGR